MPPDEIAGTPWPRLVALTEAKGQQMSWNEFQDMLKKRGAKNG